MADFPAARKGLRERPHDKDSHPAPGEKNLENCLDHRFQEGLQERPHPVVVAPVWVKLQLCPDKVSHEHKVAQDVLGERHDCGVQDAKERRRSPIATLWEERFDLCVGLRVWTLVSLCIFYLPCVSACRTRSAYARKGDPVGADHRLHGVGKEDHRHKG